MVSKVETRTAATKIAIDAFEKERDKMLDQLANLKGQADRLEWVIKVLLGQVAQIEQEESQLEQLKKQQELAMQAAREAGNVGVHPSERREALTERKQQAKQEVAEVFQESEEPKKKRK